MQNAAKQLSFYHVNFRIILTNDFTIHSFFKIRDLCHSDVQSRVVYDYICPSCNVPYMGSNIF